MSYVFELRGINPEPWQASTIVGKGKQRHGVKPADLTMYQAAVADEIRGQLPDGFEMYDGDVRLAFTIWRQIEQWETPAGRKAQSHIADLTNMQKALEDALQGVLFKNDDKVRQVSTEIVEQAVGVEPLIVIGISKYQPRKEGPA